MEDMWDIKRVLERQENTYNKVDVQSNSECRSLISSPTQNPGLPYIQIDVQNASSLQFG
jgi:glutaredoxin